MHVETGQATAIPGFCSDCPWECHGLCIYAYAYTNTILTATENVELTT